MIEQQADVMAVAEGSALVDVQRQSSCAACVTGSQCGTSVVAKLFGNGDATRLRVVDHIGLAPGERVVIGIRNQTLVRASLTAYLLPLIGLIGAAGAADQAGVGDTGSALGALVGLLLGLWLARIITGGTGEKARFRPMLLRRVASAPLVRIEPTHPTVGG
ncbi:MAG: SoxR reducing system RseC family protein [Thiohalocapsa sp.]